MKPIKFKYSNCTLVKSVDVTDKQYLGMPAYCYENDTGEYEYITCWKMSLVDRIKALVFGKVWLCICNEYHPPVWIDCTNTIFKKRS